MISYIGPSRNQLKDKFRYTAYLTERLEFFYLNEYAVPISVCTVNVYQFRSRATVYAAVWLMSEDLNFEYYACGRAGGGGYDRQSAAVADAFWRMGWSFSKCDTLHSRGMNIVKAILHRFCRDRWSDKTIYCIEAHV